MFVNPPYSIILDLVTVSFIGLGKKTITLHQVSVIQMFYHIEDSIKYTIKAKEAPFSIFFLATGRKPVIYWEIGIKSC